MRSSPDVSLRLLRYFEVLGSELNFRRAAEKLFISQPALSASIRHLEEMIGERLFDRDTRSVALTAVGREWLPFLAAGIVGAAFTMAVTALTLRWMIRITGKEAE